MTAGSGQTGYAALFGAAHPTFGAIAVASAGQGLAVATSAGAVAKARSSLEPNEDAAAVVHGVRADLLAVADAHHGGAAARLAVEHVVATFGAEPPAADVTEDDLVAVVYDASRAVADWTTQAASPQPRSRTTLAFALVTTERIQWGVFGDSLVVVADRDGADVLAKPFSAYLGDGFVDTEVAALLEYGLRPRRPTDWVILTTDGLCHGRPVESADAVSAAVRSAEDAPGCTRLLLEGALAARAADAVTVAVAAPAMLGRAHRPV